MTTLRVVRSELLFSRLGELGRYVVKDPRSSEYYHFGEQEHFLLTELDGQHTPEGIRTDFEQRFHEPLSEDDLHEFVKLADARGFLQPPPAVAAQGSEATLAGRIQSANRTVRVKKRSRITSQGLLCWRCRLFDPDRLFDWLAPKLSFCWTRTFLVVSAACIALAVGVMWANRYELVHSVVDAMSWRTAALAWLTLLAATTCHEFAHGLTCKRHGGQVHEVGFLLLYLMPGFYCNVSDAWLIPEKSKRLWVTFAGAYFDLFQWSLACFVWRVSALGSLPNELALVAVSVIGGRVFFNLNPFLKLDGYYLLTDLLAFPNLRQKSLERFSSRVRQVCWGAAGPAPNPRGRLLFWFGLLSWIFSLCILTLLLLSFARVLQASLGTAGVVTAAILWLLVTRGLFRCLFGSEVLTMITKRRFRRTVWFLVIAASLASVVLFEIEDRAGGAVQLRSLSRAEIRAPLDAFLKQVSYSEGDHVSAGSIVAQLEVSDLDSRIAQKKAEICEAKAELRALEIGPRPEEIVEQRLRVQRLTGWRDLALTQLPRRAQQASAVRDSILGLDAEAEVARREKDLADAQGNLELLEAGTRPEDLDAARAHLRRLTEELQYLQSVKARQVVATPISGQIATKHLPEKVGQYFREGDLICLVEDANRLEVLIAVPEQDIARVMPGQRVELKLRAFPFDTLDTVVERIAPVTDRGESDTAPQTELAGTITVSCQLLEPRLHLRAGMTGHARIFTGRRPIGEILLDRGLRLIRTEFWW